MSSTGVRRKRTPFDIAIDGLRDTNSADIERMKMFSAESSPISGNVGGTSTNSVTPGGSFLNIAGETPMIGAIAFNPVIIAIVDGSIDIGSSDVPPQKYSSYVLVTGQGTPDDLNYIDNALNNGQLLYYQCSATQIQNIKHASIGNISNIVGTTTVTVTTTLAHNMTTGDRVTIQSTTNFDISKAVITVTGGSTFTYAATGSATPETAGSFQNGNVLTSDGTTIVLDGTAATNAVPWIALLFDPTVFGGGAWRVQFGTGSGGGLTEPIILGINTLTPQTSPTATPIAWNTKNPQHIIIDRNITFSFTDLPTTGTYEGILVIIDIDGTGGFNTPIWPASVTNPPIVPTTANSRTSVMLYTIDAGTTVTHATSVAGSSGLLSSLTINVNKDWAAQGISNFGALTGVTGIDLDGATALIQGVKEIRFFDDDPNKNIQSAVDELSLNVPALDQFSFYANAVEMVRIEESAAGVYRLDMLDHTIRNAQDIIFEDTSGAVTFAGTDPAIGYDSVASRLILNMPTGGNLFVTNNNVIGTTQMNNNSITANIVNISDVLQLGVDATVPTVVGEMRNNGTDVTVFSGGSVRNFSNIPTTTSANTTLSNLTSPTSINENLIPQSAKTLGDSSNPWSRLTSNKITLGTAGTFSATDNEIISDSVEGMEFNTPSGDSYRFFFAGAASPATTLSVSELSIPNLQVDSNILINDTSSFPATTGQISRNGNVLGMKFDEVTIRRDTSVASETATMSLVKVDASPIASDDVGTLNFQVLDTGVTTTYGDITVAIIDATDNSVMTLNVRASNGLIAGLLVSGDDNNQRIMLRVGGTDQARIQPVLGEMGYFVTTQVTDFSLIIGTAGSLEIPRLANDSPSLTDLNQAFGAFDGAFGYESVDERLYVRESSTRWVFFAASGAVT